MCVPDGAGVYLTEQVCVADGAGVYLTVQVCVPDGAGVYLVVQVSVYLSVMMSPGLPLMFQLQLRVEGYWKGQPGLVITPLEARTSSATSPHATRHQEYTLVFSSATSPHANRTLGHFSV